MRADRLLRLYPRRWRQRYGDEFLALLESAPITRRLVRDVVRSAAREWFERTLTVRFILAPVIVTAATFAAMLLSRYVPTPPTIVMDGGQAIVSPSWPVSFGFAIPVLIFLSVALLAPSLIGPGRRFLALSLGFWVVASFIAATTSEWGDMVQWFGTGKAPTAVSTIWWKHLIPIFNCLIFSFVADLNLEYRRNPPPRVRPDVPAHPLGLGDPGGGA